MKTIDPKASPKEEQRVQYSRIQVSSVNDSVFHLLFECSSVFTVIDTLLHDLVEQNSAVTVRKFTGYNLPKIIGEILKSH